MSPKIGDIAFFRKTVPDFPGHSIVLKYLSIIVVCLTDEPKHERHYFNHDHKKVRKIRQKVHINVILGLCIAKSISTYIIT